MLEVLAYLALVYCIFAVITFGILIFIFGFDSGSFAGIGTLIWAGLAFVWPVTLSVMLYEEWKERKHKKNKKDNK